MNGPRGKTRVFKTAWFARAARKALIGDEELCAAVRQVMLGQADDLGGGVYKKRLGRNLYRSILVAKGGRYWVFAYLYAKQNRANIRGDELRSFRRMSEIYAGKSGLEIERELDAGEITEICHGEHTQIQD